MKDIYLDVEKKLRYHKEKILKEFVQKGIYPDNKLINSRLNSIDAHLSLFKNYNKVTGEKFNTNEYNESMLLIYKDLTILNDVLYELTVKEYNEQQNFINSYINELSSIVDTFEKRADFENNSTTFGKTLLFKNNNFKIENDNSNTIIKLDSIETKEASKIACFANINNVDGDNLIFSLTDVDTKKSYDVTPFNYSNEVLTIPGERNKSTYEYNLPEDQKTSGPVIMDIPAEINIKNKYIILGGKNKIFLNYRDSNNFSITDSPTSLQSFIFDEKTYINFYVVNGSSIAFKFNKKPLSTNFPIDEERISNLKPIHHFFIECDENFSFEIELSKGSIYAIKEDGIVNNNKLFYTGTDLINDFNIVEEKVGDSKKLDVELKIFNNNNNSLDIENIIIKEMEE